MIDLVPTIARDSVGGGRKEFSQMKFAIQFCVCVACIAIMDRGLPTLFRQDDQLVSWVPNPALLESLDEVEEVVGYQVRPPKGYTKNSPENPPKELELVNWFGPRRDDGSAPTFQVTIMTVPEGQPVPSFEEASEIILRAVKKRHENCSVKKTETGQINGVKFIRTEWSGVDSKFKIPKHGIEFTNMDGAKLIYLSVQDIEHHFEESSKVGLASALTFNKKK